MERRKFVIGAGALATGSAAAVGTGAFSNATAQRSVTVDTTGDADAVVGIRPVETDVDETKDIVDDNGDYASIESDQLEINLDKLNEDTDFTFQDVFVIENNGTETVNLDRVNEDGWSYNDPDSPAHVLVADEVNEFQDDGRFTWTDGDGAELEPGDFVSIGFGFWGTDGVGSWDPDDVPETITFNLGG